MSDDLLDLSGARTVKGATGAVFTCKRPTNEVATAFRIAEHAADKADGPLARQSARYEKDGEITDIEKWNEIEAKRCLLSMSKLVPLLVDETGQPPEAERLVREFAPGEVGLVIAQVMRPTVPAWATPSREND